MVKAINGILAGLFTAWCVAAMAQSAPQTPGAGRLAGRLENARIRCFRTRRRRGAGHDFERAGRGTDAIDDAQARAIVQRADEIRFPERRIPGRGQWSTPPSAARRRSRAATGSLQGQRQHHRPDAGARDRARPEPADEGPRTLGLHAERVAADPPVAVAAPDRPGGQRRPGAREFLRATTCPRSSGPRRSTGATTTCSNSTAARARRHLPEGPVLGPLGRQLPAQGGVLRRSRAAC